MIRVFEPKLNLKDKISVLKTMQQNFISGTSPTVQEFENELASKFDREYCVALSNGSVALDVALQLYDFKKDDEVIVPSFTIISCLSAILRTKATPIFCDVDINSWNMTLENIKKVTTLEGMAVLPHKTAGGGDKMIKKKIMMIDLMFLISKNTFNNFLALISRKLHYLKKTAILLPKMAGGGFKMMKTEKLSEKPFQNCIKL